ncbi:MAG TPA: hypothetical protein VKK06_08325 [Terriglobia bacterium]|nr:hypothetical protein [Terriglobia bacterium]
MLILLMTAQYRACIRSGHLITGRALLRMHSLRSSNYWLRAVALAFAPLM